MVTKKNVCCKKTFADSLTWEESIEENLIVPLAVSALVLKYPGNFSFLKIARISEISDMIS